MVVVGNIVSVMLYAGSDKQLLLTALQFYSAKARVGFPAS